MNVSEERQRAVEFDLAAAKKETQRQEELVKFLADIILKSNVPTNQAKKFTDEILVCNLIILFVAIVTIFSLFELILVLYFTFGK